MKKVFIIVPIYNGENYLKRCLDSIFNQTYKEIQIIAVNDGSKDNTLQILNGIKDNKLYVINKQNGGVSSARNAGLDYIYNYCEDDALVTFVDIDDFLEKDCIEKLVNFMLISQADISCCSFYYETSLKSKQYKQIKEDSLLSRFDATRLLIEDETIQSHSHCKLYKTNLWKNVRFPLGVGWMEDQATIFKTFEKSINGVYVSNYCGYHYWQEGESACRGKVSNKRVIDSIFGYLEPFLYEFSNFNEAELGQIKQSSLNALASTFLMMYPRFIKKSATREEKNKFKELLILIKENKVIKRFKPRNKKEKIKKSIFLYVKPFYKFLYNLFG